MSPYLLFSTLKDMLRPGRAIVWVLVASFVGIVGLILSSIGAEASNIQIFGQVMNILVFRFTALAAAVFAMAVISNEVEQKTVVYLLTQPIPRWWIMIARSLAAGIAVTLLSWAALFFAGVTTLGGSAFTSSYVLTDLLVLMLGSFAYVGIFVFISLIVRKALIVSLIFAFGWELMVQNMSSFMKFGTVSAHMNTLAAHPELPNNNPFSFLSGDMAVQDPPRWVGAVVLLLIIGGMFAANATIFANLEAVARDDGE